MPAKYKTCEVETVCKAFMLFIGLQSSDQRILRNSAGQRADAERHDQRGGKTAGQDARLGRPAGRQGQRPQLHSRGKSAARKSKFPGPHRRRENGITMH